MRLRPPPYVHAFTDRHGHARYYFRRHGKRIPLPGLPWAPDFMAAYELAKSGEVQRREIGANKILPGSVNALATAYLNSGEFQNLAKSTRATYRGILESFLADHGERSAAGLDRRAVVALVSKKAATPAAAYNLLRMVRMLMRFGIDHGWRSDDPTIGVKGPKRRTGGFHTWSENEIATFESHHALGTRARLALALLLWTAQRRSDVIKMGRQHVKAGWMTVRQQKTGAVVQIPVRAELQAAIDAHPNEHLTFLVTDFGKPFAAAGFGNWFRKVCREAGLPDGCAAHGLRKAAARRLAEGGCTAHEIMAITGHKSLREVTRYTEAADRHGLAATAMARIGNRTSSGNPNE